MTPESPEIEVEVLEIDGVAPAGLRVRPEEAPPTPDAWTAWPHGTGRVVRRFDRRWWPLWGLLGIVALGVLLTVGLVFGLLWWIVRSLLNAVRALFP